MDDGTGATYGYYDNVTGHVLVGDPSLVQLSPTSQIEGTVGGPSRRAPALARSWIGLDEWTPQEGFTYGQGAGQHSE